MRLLSPMSDNDVPELIEALTEKYREYGIGSREARRITIDMLEEAFLRAEVEAELILESVH